MDRPRIRPEVAVSFGALLLGLVLLESGCAHRREVVYPSGSPVRVRTGRGVQVRAPFVNIQVPESEPDLIDDFDEN